jgi:hypothetical protein
MSFLKQVANMSCKILKQILIIAALFEYFSFEILDWAYFYRDNKLIFFQ